MMAGDSADGNLAASVSIRWRHEVLQKQRLVPQAEQLPPIRLQLLIYPSLQGLNWTTTSMLVLHDREMLTRLWAMIVFPERGRDSRFVRALAAHRHLTRPTRERISKFFEFGPPDGSVDEVALFAFVYFTFSHFINSSLSVLTRHLQVI